MTAQDPAPDMLWRTWTLRVIGFGFIVLLVSQTVFPQPALFIFGLLCILGGLLSFGLLSLRQRTGRPKP